MSERTMGEPMTPCYTTELPCWHIERWLFLVFPSHDWVMRVQSSFPNNKGVRQAVGRDPSQGNDVWRNRVGGWFERTGREDPCPPRFAVRGPEQM